MMMMNCWTSWRRRQDKAVFFFTITFEADWLTEEDEDDEEDENEEDQGKQTHQRSRGEFSLSHLREITSR